MTTNKQIRISDEDRSSLTIIVQQVEDYFDMSLLLESPGLKAQEEDITFTYEFVEFFEAMAHDWRGWQEPKVYSNSGVKLVGVSDKTGHIKLTVQIQGPSWSTKACINLEAGQLDSLARQVTSLIEVA